MRFRPAIETKVRKTIKKVAKKMGKKPKGEETGFLTLTSVWFDNAHIFRGLSGFKVSN